MKVNSRGGERVMQIITESQDLAEAGPKVKSGWEYLREDKQFCVCFSPHWEVPLFKHKKE